MKWNIRAFLFALIELWRFYTGLTRVWLTPTILHNKYCRWSKTVYSDMALFSRLISRFYWLFFFFHLLKDLLLLKATSAATLSCLGECLSLLQHNVVQALNHNQNQNQNQNHIPLPSFSHSSPGGFKSSTERVNVNQLGAGGLDSRSRSPTHSLSGGRTPVHSNSSGRQSLTPSGELSEAIHPRGNISKFYILHMSSVPYLSVV